MPDRQPPLSPSLPSPVPQVNPTPAKLRYDARWAFNLGYRAAGQRGGEGAALTQYALYAAYRNFLRAYQGSRRVVQAARVFVPEDPETWLPAVLPFSGLSAEEARDVFADFLAWWIYEEPDDASAARFRPAILEGLKAMEAEIGPRVWDLCRNDPPWRKVFEPGPW